VRMTARPVRTGGGAPTKKPHPASAPVGAPAPGANDCPPGSHRGGAPTKKPHPTSAPVGAPAPGANDCLPGSHRGGAPTKKTSPNLRPPVGAPAPGAKGPASLLPLQRRHKLIQPGLGIFFGGYRLAGVQAQHGQQLPGLHFQQQLTQLLAALAEGIAIAGVAQGNDPE